MEPVELSDAQKKILSEQIFDSNHPGALSHDFQVVLDYVGTKGVKSAGKYNLLPLDSLPGLNERLARPLRLDLKRPQLRSNPYLMGLNLLLRASRLGRVEGSGGSARLTLDPFMMPQWDKLDPAERYFNLLEAWLLLARPEMVGEKSDSYRFGSQIRIFQTLRYLPTERKMLTNQTPQVAFFIGLGREFFNLALMDLFGLVEVDHPAGKVSAWAPVDVRMTPFGKAFVALLGGFDAISLLTLLDDQDENDTDEPDEDEDEDEQSKDTGNVREVRFGRLQSIFQPHFPEWRANLEPPAIEVCQGLHVFRVSLGKIWRRLSVPANCTLDDLLHTILESVGFDHDHLYEFVYRDAYGADLRVTSPWCDEGPFGDAVFIGELPLTPGQSMKLTYDFGDYWQFNVKFESIEPADPQIKTPSILEKHGKAPEQYESIDESDF